MLMNASLILAGLTQFVRILSEVLLVPVTPDASVMLLKDAYVQPLLSILVLTLNAESMHYVEPMASAVCATVHPIIPPEIRESNVSIICKDHVVYDNISNSIDKLIIVFFDISSVKIT